MSLKSSKPRIALKNEAVDEDEKLITSRYFDRDFYLRSYKNAIDDGVDPLDHFMVVGWLEGKDPSPVFWTNYYTQVNMANDAGGMNPLYHYATIGKFRGYKTNPHTHEIARTTDNRWTKSLSRDKPVDPSGAPIRDLASVRRAVADYFDAEFYINNYKDVYTSGLDPLEHYLSFGYREGRNPSEIFWNNFYLENHLKDKNYEMNPLLHYVEFGKSIGLKTNPYGERLLPPAVAPAEYDWRRCEHRNDLDAAQIVVIIPVYKGFDETMRAIFSAVSSTSKCQFSVLVIFDCGPDTNLRTQLERLSQSGYFLYIENKNNLGFVESVNKAISICEGKDVILLNSDAIAYDDWIDRFIYHASLNPDAATITPLSNNATICSYPQINYNNRIELEVSPSELDKFAKNCNHGVSTEVPTGVGFCMYISRVIMNVIGNFDVLTFGAGYGEEVDYCRRAIDAGYRNLFAHDIFVYHSGGISFDNKYSQAADDIERRLLTKHPRFRTSLNDYLISRPDRIARLRLDLYRVAMLLRGTCAIFVTHQQGGGIATHIDQMTKNFERIAIDVLCFKIVSNNKIKIEIRPNSAYAGLVGMLPILSLTRDLALISQFMRWADPVKLHVHSFVGLDWQSTNSLIDLIKSFEKYYYTAHDYHPLCHRNDLIDSRFAYCGVANVEVCRACIALDATADGVPDPETRRFVFRDFLEKAKTVFVPSIDVKARFSDKLSKNITFKLRYHDEELIPIAAVKKNKQNLMTIVSIGAIGPHKGSNVLYDMALDAELRDLPISIKIVGYSNLSNVLHSSKLIELGRYRDDNEALKIVNEIGPDYIFIPSIWPETYCYALSIALALDFTRVVFDIGAQAERLQTCSNKIILPYNMIRSASEINDLLLERWKSESISLKSEYKTFKYPDLLNDYYGH